MAVYLTISAHDPLIARDGRPFGLGVRMKSLDWLYPSVLAGAFRTMLGNAKNSSFDIGEIKSLKSISISGPLPFWHGKIYLPAPKDILLQEDSKRRDRLAYAIRPMDIHSKEWRGCNCNLPSGDLIPAMLPENVKDKPAKIPTLWSMEMMIKWLQNARGEGFESPPDPEKITGNADFLNLPKKERRTHVRIDPKLGTAEDTQLFETVGLDLSIERELDGIELAARVENVSKYLGLSTKTDSFGIIGGERRLARWKVHENQPGWSMPSDLASKFTGNKLRMVLATPAIFSQGWRPGWLDGWPDGEAPDYWPNNLKLKLVSACTDRWKPISGWCLEKGRQGPKPVRRLVPAGSVYFFEVLNGDAATSAKELWLKSVCDSKQDRRDGFGLALWGIWDYADENTA